MVNLSQKPVIRSWGLLVVGTLMILSIPAAFLAGWLADMSQVRPLVTQLGLAQQRAMNQQAVAPKEPPGQSPHDVQIRWGHSHVTLNWLRVPGASMYVIYRATGTQNFTQASVIGQVNQSTGHMAFVDSSVKPGSLYTYWIAASNAAGQGPVTGAVSGETFLETSTIIHQVQAAVVNVSATRWTQGGMGLFPATRHVYHPLAFNIGGMVYSPFAFAPSAIRKTWLTKRWSSWSKGNRALRVIQTHHQITILQTPEYNKRSLTSGPLTADNIIVWDSHGEWYHDPFTATESLTHLPPRAIVLNGYGRVSGLTNTLGQFVRIPL